MADSAPIDNPTPATNPPMPPLAPSDGDRPRRGALLDPGWLFLLAGVTVLAATVLIPARNDLDEARFYLDRALVVERHRLDRLEKYITYLDAVSSNDEGTIMALAAMQLNQAPAGSMLLVPVGEHSGAPATSIFSQLEPPALILPERHVERSTLEQWCLDDTPRLILTALGAMCVLIGLLPPTTPRPTITR